MVVRVTLLVRDDFLRTLSPLSLDAHLAVCTGPSGLARFPTALALVNVRLHADEPTAPRFPRLLQGSRR
jgi:hypothetical protein